MAIHNSHHHSSQRPTIPTVPIDDKEPPRIFLERIQQHRVSSHQTRNMQGTSYNYNQQSNPKNTIIPSSSPQSFRRHHLHHGQNSVEREHPRLFANNSLLAMVTPTGAGTSIEQWMSLHMRREAENYDSRAGAGSGYNNISSIERTEVSRAVYGILRDNLPPSLEYTTTQQDLTHIADSIEKKLYETASSPRAYCAFSTLEFRITALATAVLIHSDKEHNNDWNNRIDHHGTTNNSGSRGGISDTCARLSAAARKSLVYCVMVLVSFEKRNLDKQVHRMTRTSSSSSSSCSVGGRSRRRVTREKNEGYPSSQQQQLQQHRYCADAAARMTTDDNLYSRGMSSSTAQSHLRELEKYEQGNQSNNLQCGVAASKRCQSGSMTRNCDFSDHTSKNEANVQIVLEDSKKYQCFPPSA